MTDARLRAGQALVQLCARWETVADSINVADQETSAFPVFPMDYDRSELVQSCLYGDLQAVKDSIAQGVNIHVNGDWALERAASQGHLEIVRLLLNHGAHIHADEDWPIRGAADNGHPAVVALLVEQGAPLGVLTEEQREIYYLYKQEQLTARKKYVQAEQNLTEIFNAQKWVGHIPEMVELWSQVPEPLKTAIDFQHMLSDANIQTVKQLNKRKAVFIK